MNNKNYAEKIRRRKQSLKEINAELSSASTKKRRSWVWILVTVALFAVAISLVFIYKDRLPVVVSNYENLMLPIAIISALVLLLVMWFVPKFYIRTLQNKSLGGSQSEFDREKEKLKLEDDTRKTVAQIVGGAVFLFGLIFTYNTFVLNREGQITDRFTKAVAHLGEEDIAVRLGGLYALERIAKDSPKDHWTIMEILSAYVREKSPNKKLADTTEIIDRKKQSNSAEAKQTENEHIKTDVQAALTIIGRRIYKHDPPNSRIDLKGTNLSGADLVDLDLSGANLIAVNLRDASLTRTNLSWAELRGADFSGAKFFGANLKGAYLREANLEQVDLMGADLSDASLKDAKLAGTDFGGAHFTSAYLGNVDFKDAYLDDADFKDAYLGDADLSDVVDLTYEQMEIAEINEGTKLPKYLESRKQELLDISKKNLEEKERRLNENSSQ